MNGIQITNSKRRSVAEVSRIARRHLRSMKDPTFAEARLVYRQLMESGIAFTRGTFNVAMPGASIRGEGRPGQTVSAVSDG